MAFYQDSDSFYAVAKKLFDQAIQDPEVEAEFKRNKMTIRFRSTDPPAEIYLDGKSNPPTVTYGPVPGRADLDLSMEAETLHQIWLGELGLREAFFGGKVDVKGNIFRAMKLAPLFHKLEALYPQVLAEVQSGS
ncbi:MAG: SCP2 sterol-binding domain-containing protein [Chloroflexota bacterium]|nr:SCP2 sterol-binding domain-containing protein [Chloroflexota bacterium]